ncbi:MAG: nnr, partial [Frankiales bacterium]|nr:nnr [Frankiales bacterium]
MFHAHTVEQIRAAEERCFAALPPGTLMQRAATGLARVCGQELGQVYGSRVVLLVGTGTNGADALWAGVLLRRRGAAVTALTLGEPVADAADALRRAGGRVMAWTGGPVPAADLVVDGLLGIGATGALRQPYADLLAAVPDTPPLVAVDLPTGVDADTGAVHAGAAVADVTVTFGTHKPGLHVGAGRRHSGRVELVDIGLGIAPGQVAGLESADVFTGVARESRTELDKYSRGVVGVAAGSQQYTGAAVLCAGA